MTATAESVGLFFPGRLLLLLLLLVVQMVLGALLDGHRGRGGGREAQGRARRTDRGRSEARRFYVQRWRGFVIHFLYLPVVVVSCPRSNVDDNFAATTCRLAHSRTVRMWEVG